MSEPVRAADLPDGSIVARHDRVYIKTRPTTTEQWRTAFGSYCGDWRVDEEMSAGAMVLRHGYSEADGRANTISLLRDLAGEPELVIDPNFNGATINALTTMKLLERVADWLESYRPTGDGR